MIKCNKTKISVIIWSILGVITLLYIQIWNIGKNYNFDTEDISTSFSLGDVEIRKIISQHLLFLYNKKFRFIFREGGPLKFQFFLKVQNGLFVLKEPILPLGSARSEISEGGICSERSIITETYTSQLIHSHSHCD